MPVAKRIVCNLTILAVAPDGTVASQKNHVLNTTPFQYDANGSLLSDNKYTYQWDAANRLVQINVLNPQPPTMTDTITFTYDGKSRCVGITESHGSTVLTAKTFVWCGEKLCQQRDVTGHTVVNQFFDQGEQISGTNYYFAKDNLGSVREMTDSSGNVQASYDYDSWGRQAVLSQAVTADFGYAGYYVNKTTGLDLTHYRAYDTEKGRWLSRDPIDQFKNHGFGATTSSDSNLYWYANNNPIEFTDPLGLLIPPWSPPSPPPPTPVPQPPMQPCPIQCPCSICSSYVVYTE